jgi:hypothetical protein
MPKKRSSSSSGEKVTESLSERILGVKVSNNLKWREQYRAIVNNLRYRIFTLKKLTYHLPRSALHSLLDGVVYSVVRYCLPLFSKVRVSHSDLHIGGPDSVQKQLNCALRIVQNVKLMDKVSIVKLHEETKKLTFNQLAIESMRKLVMTIMNNESRGLKDFFEANLPQEKCLRSTIQGKLNPPLRRQTGHSFREQAIRVWNDLDDKARWAKKMPKLMLLDFP